MNRTRYRVPAHVVRRHVGDELVLLSMSSEQYFGLDPIGAEMFEHLAAGSTVEEMVAAVAAAYEVPRSQVEVDATSLLEQLSEAELLEPLT